MEASLFEEIIHQSLHKRLFKQILNNKLFISYSYKYFTF